MFCAENSSKKQQIFEKYDGLENRPFCKGYSLCKMVSLGQKLKMPKTCDKPFYKIIRVVLFKKRSKKHHIFKEWDDFENRPSCKGYSPCKEYSLCKMVSLGQKLKRPKHAKNHSTRILKLFCAKNCSKKHQIFEKWDDFENRPSCKGYSLSKMVSLGQKLKMPKTCDKPFYKIIRVVLFKKR